MMDFIIQIMPNVVDRFDVFVESFYETLIMSVISGSMALLLGLIFGTILVVTRPGDILENKWIYTILGKIIDLFRAAPFIILAMMLTPISQFFMGTSIGLKGAIIPLIIGTAPFCARQMEQALSEIDKGLVEASQSMGFGPFEIIWKVYLRESIPSIIRGFTITLISMIGLTAILGVTGSGGLGVFCINYGYNQYNYDILWVSLAVLVLLTILVQTIGNYMARKTTH